MAASDALSAETLFAAGLLAGDDSLSSDANIARLANRLGTLIAASATSGPGSATEPPTWVAPDPVIAAQLAPNLQKAWLQVTKLPWAQQFSVLYVRVLTVADAVRLAEWDQIATFRVVASMAGAHEAAAELGPDEGGSASPQPPPFAPPPPSRRRGVSATRPEVEAARQLIAEMFRAGKVCEQVLEPHTEHTLAVRIAIPRPGQQGIAFDEGEIDFGDNGTADLIIDVTSDDGTFHATAKMVLPEDRKRASTTAAFAVQTGDEGSILQLNITVLYRNRPIRSGLLVASVRANPLPDDLVQFWPVPLSAAPEPTSITRADAALEDDGVTLSVRGTDHADAIPLNGVEDWSAAFEQEASQVLGTDFAPGAIDHPDAVRLLIRLARRGRRFADTLAELGLQNARVISVLVRYNAPVLPLELAYDGPAPSENAKLCDCGRELPPPDGRCPKASRMKVCPSAFWGMNRVIARTVRFGRLAVTEPRPQLRELSLRPVVYAAANRADNGSPPAALPSHLLQNALTEHAGADHVTRVTNWRDWRTAVKQTNPQLLVVLGHTDQAQSEVRVEIGKESLLSQPDISNRELGTPHNPAPVLLLFACDSAVSGDVFGALPGTFIYKGAAAVVASLTKFKGQHAADACVAVSSALYGSAGEEGLTLGTALTRARRDLVARGLLVGLLLVAVGEIDVNLTT